MSDELGGAADTAIEHAGADAAAGLAGRKGGARETVCPNCRTPLVGDFCHACGQSAQSLRRPFGALLAESLETLFSIDGRLARTVPPLMLFPGRMTRAYLDGQRARFIPPFRLYVFASLIFFIILPLMMGRGLTINFAGSPGMEDARAQAERALEAGTMTEAEYQETIRGLDELDALWRGGPPGLIAPDPPSASGDEDAPTPPEREWAGFIPLEAWESIREAGEAGNEDAARLTRVADNPDQLAARTMDWIPRLMFLLLPFYAGLLALVYLWRRRFLFFDHLIVSLHFHSALFLGMAVGALVSPLIGAGWVVLALIVYSNWYLYRLQRVVYARGRFGSVARVILLDTVYFCALMAVLMTAVILGALSL